MIISHVRPIPIYIANDRQVTRNLSLEIKGTRERKEYFKKNLLNSSANCKHIFKICIETYKIKCKVTILKSRNFKQEFQWAKYRTNDSHKNYILSHTIKVYTQLRMRIVAGYTSDMKFVELECTKDNNSTDLWLTCVANCHDHAIHSKTFETSVML